MSEPSSALLDAAHQVIHEVGIERATIERIAVAAGLSRVTLHRRGISRIALISGLVDRIAAAYRDCMVPALVSSGTGAERLRAALLAICGAAEPHLSVLAGLYDSQATVFHELLADGRTVTRLDFTAPLQRLLQDGAADGSLRTVDDLAETAEVLFNAAGWTYVHLRRSHGWPADRAAAAVTDLQLAGVAGPPR